MKFSIGLNVKLALNTLQGNDLNGHDINECEVDDGYRG